MRAAVVEFLQPDFYVTFISYFFMELFYGFWFLWGFLLVLVLGFFGRQTQVFVRLS